MYSALALARDLAAAGIPIFVARPDPSAATGFSLPVGWQQTAADPSVVDLWRPGDALCAVMGHGLDLVDVDPRNGGSLDAVPIPRVYGVATTPSGGVHAFVRSLGVRSRNNVIPGVDVKAGDADGKGRGFAFIAPTIRTSKVTGQPVPYVWLDTPDLYTLRRVLTGSGDDVTGEALRELVTRALGGGVVIPASDVSALENSPSVDRFMEVGPWVDVARTLAGGRNDGVMRLAAALRGEGGWSVERALDYMTAIVWPVIDQSQAGHEFGIDEFEGIIRGVWDRYPDGRAARLDEASDSASERPPALVGVGLLDAWIVDRISANRLSGRFLWARGLGWLGWDGRRWAPCDASIVVDDVRQYVQWLHASAATAGADSDLLKRIAGLGGKTRLAGLVDLCRGVAGVRCSVSEFDAHPDLLNCANGVVDLRDGSLTEHDPGLRLTKITPVAYVPGAESADWKHALEALPDDVREWWQLRIGQAATGHMTPDDLLIVQVGTGSNGKTTLMSAIRGALGEYYLLVSHRALLGNTDSIPTELMDFRGARLALLEETPEERRLAVTKLKALVGTPEITARRMRQDPVTFAASHSLFISTNYLPVVSETDHGTWRRLACLRFPFKFKKPSESLSGATDRRGDPNLRDRLVAGADGQHEAVLAWIVAGAVRWYAGDRVMPAVPERVEAGTREWRESSDLVLAYVSERLEFDPLRHVMASELIADVNDWLVQHGHRPWSNELLASRFGDHGEIDAHNVSRIRIRNTHGISRRPVRLGMPTESDPDGQYWAWTCLKFANEDNGTVTRETNPDGPVPLLGPAKSQVPLRKAKPASTSNYSTSESSETTYTQTTSFFNYSECQRSIEGIGMGCLTRLSPVNEDQLGSSPKVSKAEQRRQAKAEAARDAAGEILSLPARVHRDGTVAPIQPAGVLLEYADRPVLTVDVETTGYPVGHADYALRTIQLGDAYSAVVLDATDPHQCELARDCLATATTLHAHSATADLVPLADAGIVDYDEAWSRMRDTVIPAKLADPQSTGSDPALKQLAGHVLGVDAVSPAANEKRANLFHASGWLTETKPTTPVARSGWAQVDSRCVTMITYAASDVLDTAALPDRIPTPPPVVDERERLAQRMTARVAYRGLPLDQGRVVELLAEHERALVVAGEAVAAFGVTNPGSDKQVAEKLTEMGAQLPRTATGRPSVARDALEPLKDDPGAIGGLVRARLEFEHHEKLISAFLQPYSVQCTRGDGRVRPTVYTLGADTGRMACVRPNLQQVPRSGGIRSCITADGGFLLISADFASVEVRVMAALSQDPMLMHALAAGLDIHGMIAEQVYGSGWTKAQRYSVKRGVFGWAYGGGIDTLAKQIGVSHKIMADVVDALKQLAPTYVQWAENLKNEVRGGRTTFETYSGRVIHLDSRLPHKAPNYVVQGTARELLIDALVQWSATRWGNATLLPVHDELLVMAPADEAQDATHELVRCMERDLYGVHIAAEASEPSCAWKDAA